MARSQCGAVTTMLLANIKNCCEFEIVVVPHRKGRKAWSRGENLKNCCDPATMGYHHLHLFDDDTPTFSSPGRDYLTCLKNTEEHVTNFVQVPTK